VVDAPEALMLDISNPLRLQRDWFGRFVGYTIIRKRSKINFPETETEKRYIESSVLSFPTDINETTNSFVHNIGSYIAGKNNVIDVGYDITGSGNYYQYVLNDTITVVGNYYAPFETSEEYGESFGTNFSLPSNELVQSANTLNGNELYPTLLENIVKKYSKGKEVYTIKCSVGEYYDIYGAKAIDPYDTNYPATFEKHEIVEPYVFTSQGEVPLSEKADGTPKRFEIIGIDFSYKGVVWQELTLQEYIE
jgi:hypothetical protein